MRYSIDDLIKRAAAGNIGRRGLHRLSVAGYDAGPLAASGVDATAQLPDVGAALDTRREGLFLRAIQRAQLQAANGGHVSAATRARLQHVPEGISGGFSVSQDTGAFTPAAAAGGGAGGTTLEQLIEQFRKRRAGALSNASVYSTL